MLKLSINVNAVAARESIAATIEALENRQEINQAAAGALETKVADHLRGLNSRSPNTSFYSRAARSAESNPEKEGVASKADADGAEVSITHRGLALRFYGGRVNPVDAKALAIPQPHVPLAGKEGRIRPREAGILAFIPSRGTREGTIGWLVEGVEKEIERGPRKGGKRIAPKVDGKLMYTLRSWTDHPADPSVLPTIAEMIGAAEEGIAGYLASFNP